MEKIVEFSPAYDKRHADPSKNYGVGSVKMRMILKGELGATQFLVYTSWYLPEVTRELRAKHSEMFEPLPGDVGYHSPKQMYEGQTSMGACPYLDGKECYHDGSGLRAEEVFKDFLREGDSAVWKELEEYYIDLFGELK